MGGGKKGVTTKTSVRVCVCLLNVSFITKMKSNLKLNYIHANKLWQKSHLRQVSRKCTLLASFTSDLACLLHLPQFQLISYISIRPSL